MILQAPFVVGCVVMVASRLLFVGAVGGPEPMLATGLPALQLNILARPPGEASTRRCDHRRLSVSSSDLLCTVRKELSERVDHGDNRLAKVFVLHAGGAPEAASASHVAAVSCRATTVGRHGFPLDFQVMGTRLSLDDLNGRASSVPY